MRRIAAIAFAALTVCALTQCASPLDPDTPRTFSPGTGDDLITPPVVTPLRLRLTMNGFLQRQGASLESWPKKEMIPDSQRCFVDTALSPQAFTLRGMYKRNVRPEDIPGEYMHIYAIKLNVDSAALDPLGTLLLNGPPHWTENFIEFQVVTRPRGSNIPKLITVSGNGVSSDSSIFLREAQIRSFARRPETEKAYTMELYCVFKVGLVQPETYDFTGQITLKYD